MKGWMLLAGCAALALGVTSATACSFCEGSSIAAKLTLREEAALPTAKLILHGTIANPTIDDKGKGGRTDFAVAAALRAEKGAKVPAKLVLPRYLPVEDPKNPPHYLLFCGFDDKRGLDPYRGVPLEGGAKTVEYVKKSLALDPKKHAENLAFFFGYLDDKDPEVSRDAFLEFAKATDATILAASAKFSPDKLRGWLADPKTPAGRLSVYALLLGACGKGEDAAELRKLLDSQEERYTKAADGILAGYLQLDPKKGWALLAETLADGRKPLLTRLGAIRTLRFQHASAPKQHREQILKVMRTVLAQGDLADLAIEDLRKWAEWDLTDDVLKRYGTKGYDAPLIKRAIIRYALCCAPTKASKDFLAARRADDRQTVEDMEDYLKLESGR